VGEGDSDNGRFVLVLAEGGGVGQPEDGGVVGRDWRGIGLDRQDCGVDGRGLGGDVASPSGIMSVSISESSSLT
jgi:hypothetical protein